MKKLVKFLVTVGTAAAAVAGGIYLFQKYFSKEEELDNAFDDDELFEEEESEEVPAFESEEEIFEDETPVKKETAVDEETAADQEPEAEPVRTAVHADEEPEA